nr:nucleolar protein 14 homolog [Leptinotarsa decemlineata]
MAKIKNKSKFSADRIHKKKEKLGTKPQMNPFEVHVNKEKLRVIGKKAKNDRGLPGVSRGKSIEKRKYTLLKEYKVQNKSNKFMDKRIGEKSHEMTSEDKAMARFTAVRIKAHNKKSIFNLAEDEILTHKGQTLSEIEKFDDPRSDDESLDEDSGKLEKDFVGEAHFGGGILKKTGVEGAKSHKDLIDQLIAESKKRKAEKQKAKEATLELTEKLDEDWKDLLPLVNKSRKTGDDGIQKSKVDNYDRLMGELRFEARGTVSDRLKTEDEVAKEEKDRLEQLEKDRLARMQGFVNESNVKINHRSADDLDDDIVYEEDPDYVLSYNTEGQSNFEVNADINGKTLNGNQLPEEEGSCDEKSEEIEKTSDEELETDSEDNLSDLKEDTSESDESETEEAFEKVEDKLGDEVCQEVEIKKSNEDIEAQEKIKRELAQRKEIMEKARNELPYTYSLPDSYESLLKLFENQPSTHQSVILERIIKCNHPSLSEGNKDNLGLLFAYLLQYLNDLFSEIQQLNSVKNSFEIFRSLLPQIYELAQLNPENAHNSVLEVIKEKHQEYRKKPKTYPGLEVFVFLKLVSILFSTSDFRHQVVTPCFIFIEQILNHCKNRNRREISYGIFLTTIVLEYTSISRRYLPAVINYLAGLLHMAIPKTGVKLIKVIPPFKPTSSILVLLKNFSLKYDKTLLMESTDLIRIDIDEDFKLRTLYNVTKLLEEFHHNLSELPSAVEIFEPVLRYLILIPTTNYPEQVRNVMEKLKTSLKESKIERKLEYIVMEAKRPKALRLYEPKIEEVYDGKRFKVQSKEKAERSKLLHKLKNERKGAIREIRKDKAFLGRVKINQQIRSDNERREKVKRIYAEAAMQQSELNELDRKKKRKK